MISDPFGGRWATDKVRGWVGPDYAQYVPDFTAGLPLLPPGMAKTLRVGLDATGNTVANAGMDLDNWTQGTSGAAASSAPNQPVQPVSPPSAPTPPATPKKNELRYYDKPTSFSQFFTNNALAAKENGLLERPEKAE